MDRRQANIQKRKHRILRAAADLIGTQGLEGLSMRGLAEEARLDVTTLYNLYGSKADILLALRRSGVEELELDLGEDPSEDPLAHADHALREWIRRCDERAAVARPLILAAYPEAPWPGEGPVARPIRELLTVSLEEAQKRGLLGRAFEPELLARQIFLGLHAFVPLWARGALDASELETRVLYGLYVCLVAVATEKARPRLTRELRRLEKQLMLVERIEPETSAKKAPAA